jgi:FAD/FMN-containing dehydrogenase
MTIVAGISFDPSKKPANEAWVDQFKAQLEQGYDGAYVNFLNDEGEERVRDAYPAATWERLARTKRRYDPTNLFRRNQNVPPASA